MVIITMVLLNIINNYWTRLGKISWFVRGEQINYLPKPKAEANNWSARHWQITIFCDNRVQELFYHLITEFVFFNEYPRETKRSAIFTQRRSQEGEKHGFLYACAQYNLQQLDGIAHEQTIICRQFFCRSRGGFLANEKKEKFASNDNEYLSSSNDDGDVNENGKKSIGSDWQNNNFARTSRFFVHFAVTARLRRENV